MATQLNPGADATLVQAAYYAAMANVPKDLSGTFEALASNYATTMQTMGQAWGEVAKIGGKFMGEAVETWAHGRKMNALGSLFQDDRGNRFLLDGTDMEEQIEIANPEYIDDATTPGVPKTIMETRIAHVDGLNDIKRKLKDTWKKDPFSVENRAERIKLKQQRDDLYAQIDMLQAGFSNVADALASGEYSKDAMASNVGDARFLAAVGAFTSKTGKAENGDYVTPGYDKDGSIVFKLFDKDGSEVFLNDGVTQVSHKATNINKILIPDDKGALDLANKLFENIYKQGRTGPKDANYDVVGKIFRNQLASAVGTEGSLHSMMHNKKIWSLGKSFTDDLTNHSILSVDLFNALGGKIPVDKNNNPVIDISGGTDPNAFDAGDIAQNSTNYASIVSALTNKNNQHYDEGISREVFLDWAEREGKAVFEYGQGLRDKSKSSSSSSSDSGKTETGFVSIKGNDSGNVKLLSTGSTAKDYVSADAINSVGALINSRGEITGTGDVKFTFDKDKDTYIDHNGDVVDNPGTLFQAYFGGKLSPDFIQSKTYKSLKGWKGAKVIKTKELNVKFTELFDGSMDDDDVSDWINDNYGEYVTATTPYSFKEMIKVDGKKFYIGGSNNTNAESEKKRLVNYLNLKKRQSELPG